MITTLTSREQFSYQKNGMAGSAQAGSIAASSPVLSSIAKGDQVHLSDASRTAMKYNAQALDFSANWTDTKLDLGEGITANAKFSLNYAERFESLELSFTFSAESMGYTSENFKGFGGKPIELHFEFFQQIVDYVKESKLTISGTKRGADEIIADIAAALREVFQQKGDKLVQLSMDTEAFQTLLENVDTRNMLDDIVALIGIINSMRLHEGPRDQYQILISGKGKPRIDYEEKVDLKIEGSKISIRLTIQPPKDVVSDDHKSTSEEIPS